MTGGNLLVGTSHGMVVMTVGGVGTGVTLTSTMSPGYAEGFAQLILNAAALARREVDASDAVGDKGGKEKSDGA